MTTPETRPSGTHQHPIGTLVFIGAYGLLFVLGWVAVYVYVFLQRGRVTP